VSKNDDCHSAATTKIVVKSHGKGLLRVLQSSSENRYRGCRHDMLGWLFHYRQQHQGRLDHWC